MNFMLVSDVCDDYEIIDGKKFLWKSADIGHNIINGNLLILLASHVKENRLGFVFSHFYIYFPDGSLLFPDIVFLDKVNEKFARDNSEDGFHGVPDMVAEIFSRSTMKRDFGIKKDIYERNGVREYWIIDPWREYIDVYLLRDGKYALDGHYENWSEDDLEELAQLPEEERVEVKPEIPVAVLDGFKIKIRNIFGWYFE